VRLGLSEVEQIADIDGDSFLPPSCRAVAILVVFGGGTDMARKGGIGRSLPRADIAVRICGSSLGRRDEKKVPEFYANFRFRTPDYATLTAHVQLINRQLKIVRNACGAGKCEASAQIRDIANHAVPKRLARGNLGTPVHFGAVVSSSFGHARILDKKHCVKIKGNARKMLTVINQSAEPLTINSSTALILGRNPAGRP
jgi:hypothetical protein